MKELPKYRNNYSPDRQTLWGLISQKFVEEAPDKANFRIMASDTTFLDRKYENDFGKNIRLRIEIPELLKKADITIDGFHISDILASGNGKSFIVANSVVQTILSQASGEFDVDLWKKLFSGRWHTQPAR